ARVVIDEASGIIVMGGGVRVNEVAVAQGNLTVRVTESEQVSQPGAFAQAGETKTVDRSDIEIDDGSDKRLTLLKPGVNLSDLVDGLNALGVGPRDLIAILQTIKAAGALQAEILVQ
ncbi:MAG: flagellar basal body P-ring protein FlgI, partial [Rhodospirillaceae bacterium]|nr:flagellar basal body P-ring protein FlgI [Rhodospirillaceae bacterium]